MTARSCLSLWAAIRPTASRRKSLVEYLFGSPCAPLVVAAEWSGRWLNGSWRQRARGHSLPPRRRHHGARRGSAFRHPAASLDPSGGDRPQHPVVSPGVAAARPLSPTLAARRPVLSEPPRGPGKVRDDVDDGPRSSAREGQTHRPCYILLLRHGVCSSPFLLVLLSYTVVRGGSVPATRCTHCRSNTPIASILICLPTHSTPVCPRIKQALDRRRLKQLRRAEAKAGSVT